MILYWKHNWDAWVVADLFPHLILRAFNSKKEAKAIYPTAKYIKRSDEP